MAEKEIMEVAAALIRDGDRFLICRRPAHKTCPLLWEFAGGKVEPGETKAQALARECREELAVTVAVGDAFMETEYAYPDRIVRLTLLNAVILEGVPQRREHSELRWIKAEDIPDYAFCPANEAMLRRLQDENARVF